MAGTCGYGEDLSGSINVGNSKNPCTAVRPMDIGTAKKKKSNWPLCNREPVTNIVSNN